MKKAVVEVHTFDIICPNCSEYVVNEDNGSVSWSAYEEVPKTIKCNFCKTVFSTPNKVPSVKLVRKVYK